jgi:hypothetical protein
LFAPQTGPAGIVSRARWVAGPGSSKTAINASGGVTQPMPSHPISLQLISSMMLD